MKKYLTWIATAFFASVAISMASPDNAAIEAKEKAAWEAFKTRNAAEFKKLVSPDLVAVYPAGVNNLQAEIDAMSKMEVKSSEISGFKVVMSGDDTAIDTYTVKLTATMEGQDISGTHNCATIWQKKNGEWRAIFHTDMKAEEAAK